MSVKRYDTLLIGPGQSLKNVAMLGNVFRGMWRHFAKLVVVLYITLPSYIYSEISIQGRHPRDKKSVPWMAVSLY